MPEWILNEISGGMNKGICGENLAGVCEGILQKKNCVGIINRGKNLNKNLLNSWRMKF